MHPRLLMCSPQHFGVHYVINPWMTGNQGRVRPGLAMEQWTRLHSILSEVADIELVDPQPGLPDMCFVANAGLVDEQTAILARFLPDQRKPEETHFEKWFRDHGYDVHLLEPERAFEGEGDLLIQPGTGYAWAGYGVRSSLQSQREVSTQLSLEVIPLRLTDERYYHLDTCFCPLPGNRLVYYSAAFDHASLESIAQRVPEENHHDISEADALGMACNAVVIGDLFVTNFASEALKGRLESWGFRVVQTELSEFLLAGGSAKCLVLQLTHAGKPRRERPPVQSTITDRVIEMRGHLLDTGIMNTVLDAITEAGGSFEMLLFEAGVRKDQHSLARMRVFATDQVQLDRILSLLVQQGARVVDDVQDARLETVTQAGVAPDDFYSTTIFPTDVRVKGEWIRASHQRMDAMLVVSESTGQATARCVLMRDLQVGEKVVCGVDGIEIHPVRTRKSTEAFSFMSSGVSSERRVETAVEETAWEMRRIRERGGKIVIVAGPVVVHTGGAPYLARLIREGYVQSLLGGNAIAVHDLELSLYGTSLGVDLARGIGVHGGHRHHLKVINLIRSRGGISNAVNEGLIPGGIMYECVKNNVPFVLAGSIRDDGPLPETEMDLIRAQKLYSEQIQGADMIMMLCSMLHSIGTGNMTPSGVKLICVDISPSVVTKLADRGSVESVGIVTDVGLFLNLLVSRLGETKEENQ